MIHQDIENENPIAACDPIAKLNDNLRRNWDNPVYGTVVLTTGIQALCNSEPLIACLMQKISDFDSFSGDSDPYKERDFGLISFWGQKVYWKINYYNPAMTEHSENPADPYVTRRVMTVMLAGEY